MKKWLSELFSTGGNVSTKRVAFISVIVSSIVWLTTDLATNGMTSMWVLAFQSLLAAAGAGYISGIFSEKHGDSDKPKQDEEDVK